MSEPRTAAGKRLLTLLNDDVSWFVGGGKDVELSAILAIEAESASEGLDVERLAKALHVTAPRNHNLGEGPARAVCASVESHLPRAKAIAALRPEHEHYWIDAPDDETGWHCTICGLTVYSDRAEPAASEGLREALERLHRAAAAFRDDWPGLGHGDDCTPETCYAARALAASPSSEGVKP